MVIKETATPIGDFVLHREILTYSELEKTETELKKRFEN